MSKFDKIFEAREEKSEPIRGEEKQSRGSGAKTKNRSGGAQSSKKNETPEIAEKAAPGRQRGRPKAKRSDPDFIGFTTYIRKNTHLKVKIALLQEGEGRELSQLVEELLGSWLADKSRSA